ncbi:hypothetical protein [Acrocarpospora catenulata]|nr:hypothetical protein [Acrocarpospora catenulata]
MRVTRLNQHGRYLLAYCGTPQEVAKHVDLADLVQVIPLPARPGQPR